MKNVLIISPYFPPVNAADMQRVRMSLPYFTKFGWNPEVVTVDEKYTDIAQDDLLLQSVPDNIIIHRVKAFNKKWTSKLGLGSIGLRSLFYYFLNVNSLLKNKKYDLIYFSTTQFPVCILGAYWKKRFKIPYVIDMQDPWFSNYYQDKPKSQRPKKYWFSYHLNKYLEPIAMKKVDGLISVSDSYISDLKKRYPSIKNVPGQTITFGAFKPDMEIAASNKNLGERLLTQNDINIIYVGRGGNDMHSAISPVFEALQFGLKNSPQLFNKLKFYFIGTSYASSGRGVETIMPLAKKFQVENNVIEITNRISYYQTLNLLQEANALFIPGSDDPKYTASKIYPYLLTLKPILAIFNSNSSTLRILEEYGVINSFSFDLTPDLTTKINAFLCKIAANDKTEVVYNQNAMEEYSAETITKMQVQFFEVIIKKYV